MICGMKEFFPFCYQDKQAPFLSVLINDLKKIGTYKVPST